MRRSFKGIATYLILSAVLFYSVGFAGEQSNESALIQGNSAFAVDLYHKLRTSDGNIFFSPYSISTALAMTYAGARGNTEREMAETLRFSLRHEDLHQAFADITLRLNTLQKAKNITLSVANSLWPQKDHRFLDEYLSLIEKYYGVSITPVDYKNAREVARQMINTWVANETQDKIKDLIAPGVLDALTRLVLVNAIYFKGNWENQFNPALTKDAAFHVFPGKSVQVPIMDQERELRYADFGTLQVLELPYVEKELSMLVLLPRADHGIARLEKELTAENLRYWGGCLEKRDVRVFMPRFKMTSMFRLEKTLAAMGMVDAFSVLKANFAGMDGRSDWLYIGAVIHKAFVEVNEEGTEAAAATAVVMKTRGMSAPPAIFRADHPFIFLIRENVTGNILFIGRVADPLETGAPNTP